VKENGVWKIKALRYFPSGTAVSPKAGPRRRSTSSDGAGKGSVPRQSRWPDALIEPRPRLWPATDTVPFHYPHPVTGQPIVLDNSRAREGFKD